MNSLKTFLLVLLFAFPFFVHAQSLVGNWTIENTGPDGTTMQSLLTFNDDGTMTIDFMNDGRIDVRSDYKVDGNKVTVKDTQEHSDCYGTIGIYEVSFDGNTCSVKPIDDPCDTRRGDGSGIVMTRVE